MNAIIAFSLRFRALMVALYAFVMIGGVTAGRVARRLAAALCARGEPPRALVRNANKARDVLIDHRGAPLPLEMVVSDFAERDGLRRALAGIEIAFLALGSSLQQVELEQRFIDVAAEVRPRHWSSTPRCGAHGRPAVRAPRAAMSQSHRRTAR